jgi:aspartyl protease
VRQAFLFAVCLLLLLAPFGRAAGGQSIPFEYRDGLIWVKVRSAASGAPLNFLLDSGAGVSVLSADAAHRLGVKLGVAETVRRVGTDAAAWHVSGFEATLAGIPVCREPLVLDLRDTSASCCRPIDGLLGQDFFRGRVVQINFKEQCIRLLDKADEHGCCAVLRLSLQHGVMCVPISVNDSALKWARLDTGCDDGLHWVARGAAGHARTSLQLGAEKIANVKTTLHRSALFPEEAGLLGNGILAGYQVTIDGVSRRLLLEKS